MRPVLIADIGATNCRFAVTTEDGRPAQMIKLRGDVVGSLQEAIAHYLDEAKVRPRAAVLAVAAPVAGDAISMTNRAWNFRLTELAARFGWTAARAMNDFEAVARGVSRLTPDDVRPLGPTMLPPSGPRVVFGPGTGLGVAALVPNGPSWRVV
ncbi:MAG: glucokinase, partial [Variibacter sp.]|nr:glucokinase [Variibacter sp.]